MGCQAGGTKAFNATKDAKRICEMLKDCFSNSVNVNVPYNDTVADRFLAAPPRVGG